MAVLSVDTVSRTVTSIAGTLAAAAGGGDSFPNTGAEFVIFKNTDAGAVTVTFVMQSTIDGTVVVNKTIVVPATTGLSIVGPFPTSMYNDTNNRMNMTYSAVTALTVAVYKLSTS